MFEEAIHAEQSGYRKPFLKSGFDLNWTAGEVKRDLVQPCFFLAADAGSDFAHADFRSSPMCRAKLAWKRQRVAPESIKASNLLVRGRFANAGDRLTLNITA
jgi:hypothetical protein